MTNKKDFFDHWFNGFSSSMTLLSSDERAKVMTQCGKACAEAYTNEVFQKAWKNAEGDISKCIRSIQVELAPDMIFEPVDEPGIPEGKCYDVVYNHCLCELVSKGFVTSPTQCECSRQGMLYNWESLVGKGNVSVETKQTILGGAKNCILRIMLR